MNALPPLVSIAIPLFRSAPFVPNITANIERLTYPSLEIIISDRHGTDDALEQLEGRFGADPRVRVLRSTDGADWVMHYNDLLVAARGTYFCWMPHDDRYDPGYIDHLAAALDGRPDAILAFGVMHAEGIDVEVPVGAFTPPPFGEHEQWSLRTALGCLLSWELFRVVRGLVRRDEVLKRRLFVPRPHATVHADVCWAFSLAVAAPFVFVPAASCIKQYRTASASAGWHYGIREALSEWRVTSGMLWRSAHSRLHVLGAIGLLTAVAGVRLAWRTIRPVVGRAGARVPTGARARAARGLSRVLASRRRR